MKTLCRQVAKKAGVCVDKGIYDISRILRLPNSRHRSGLYKRFIDLDDFEQLDLTRIKAMAKEPFGIDVPELTVVSQALADDWNAAKDHVPKQSDPNKRDGARVPLPCARWFPSTFGISSASGKLWEEAAA